MNEEDYIVKFYKEPGRDLVILNLADVQFNDLFDTGFTQNYRNTDAKIRFAIFAFKHY